MYVEGEILLHVFLNSALHEAEWLDSSYTAAPSGKEPSKNSTGDRVGTRAEERIGLILASATQGALPIFIRPT
jgi:hypothetical protein